MTLKKVVVKTLATEPFSSLLEGIASSPAGRRRLNSMSGAYGVHGSFAEGWAAARKTSALGHEDPEEIEIHLHHLAALRPSDYAALFWISQIQPRGAKVFDYGGSVGNLYYSYSPCLQGLGSIDWTVFDIPSVVEEGRRIAAERKVSNLRFVNSLDGFGPEEILLVSGAFHYWETNVSGFLAQFKKPPEHIIINRSPVHEAQPSFITVQRTPSCAFPCRVWNAGELLSEFAQAGFRLVDRWQSLELSLNLPLFPKHSVASYSGFYFRKIDRA